MFGIPELVSFLGGVAAGLLTNVLWDMRFALRRRLSRMLAARIDSRWFDPASVGLYPINRWSAGRALERHRLRMTVRRNRPAQVWCDLDEWQRLSGELSQHYSGNIAYLVGFSIDHRESEHGAYFDYTVAPCDYFEYLATEKYLAGHPDVVERIREMLAAGRLAEFAGSAPPSLIKINVSLLNSGNRFLALQRSGAVHAKRGLWTVGPNETMRLVEDQVPGSRPEHLFDLAERCLREELGIESSDYQSLTISWIGYEAQTTSVKVFAQAFTDLPESRIIEAVEGAHGAFEVQRLAWLPFNRSRIAEISRSWQAGDSGGRAWSASAPLALAELWRMRTRLRNGG